MFTTHFSFATPCQVTSELFFFRLFIYHHKAPYFLHVLETLCCQLQLLSLALSEAHTKKLGVDIFCVVAPKLSWIYVNYMGKGKKKSEQNQICWIYHLLDYLMYSISSVCTLLHQKTTRPPVLHNKEHAKNIKCSAGCLFRDRVLLMSFGKAQNYIEKEIVSHFSFFFFL